MNPADSGDIFVWADGTWCYRSQLHEYSWKSDDTRVLTYRDAEWWELQA